jgi:alpha/beta superfamily hydrolase
MRVGIEDARVRALVSIGTPVDKYDFSFMADCRKPVLFVHGERDEFGSTESLRALVARLPQEARAQLEIIEHADHFFAGHLDALKRAITEWANHNS